MSTNIKECNFSQHKLTMIIINTAISLPTKRGKLFSSGSRNIWYLSEIYLKPKSCEASFAHNLFPSYLIVSKWCCNEHGSPQLCSLQIFKLIEQLKRILWTNEISRDLSSRWVKDRFPYCMYIYIYILFTHDQSTMFSGSSILTKSSLRR